MLPNRPDAERAPWRALPPPAAALRVSVIIPVRNEAEQLPAALAALACQVDADGAPFNRARYEILVLANNCSDGSAEAVRDTARRQPTLALHVAEVALAEPLAHVGHARRLLMDEACRRLPPHGVIASTDGDTVVAPGWLAGTLEEIDAGADAVGGRILTAVHPESAGATMRCLRLDTAYRLAREKLQSRLDPDPADPWPHHHQHFGASLAITRAAYERVGGLPEVPYLEDEALVQALRRHDLRMRHSPRVRVMTSGRLGGRAEIGLSWLLNEWARQGSRADALRVDDADELAAQAPARRRLRERWRQPPPDTDAAASFGSLAAFWGVPADWLADRTAAAETFGGLWNEVEARRLRGPQRPQVPVRQAIDQLRALADAAGTAAPAAGSGEPRPAAPVDRLPAAAASEPPATALADQPAAGGSPAAPARVNTSSR